jgi:hypothetical protein
MRVAARCPRVDSGAVTGPSSAETWDAFFSDFYLRAYADDQRRGEGVALGLLVAGVIRIGAQVEVAEERVPGLGRARPQHRDRV